MNDRLRANVYARFATAPDPESFMRFCWASWQKAEREARAAYQLAIKRARA